MGQAGLGDARLAGVDVLLNTGFGVRADQQADIKKLWPKLTGLKWMHVASAGHSFPCLKSPSVTNLPMEQPHDSCSALTCDVKAVIRKVPSSCNLEDFVGNTWPMKTSAG